ncbi:hypothetical protein SAMN05216267_106811 [Actinacidiphila rubida]|uniref:Uncharacterized protein n=1 Tax=Actinacidiphila rubida TaxID=310780 RepID=A0A1H8RAK9_9ACTN|nr:hypothetical protein SAMN05216267_103389 [Actinacidiphila rubida]SEP00349.1 hypothetical protein SAMN05216267_106811 [Actinacidiphila rubida]
MEGVGEGGEAITVERLSKTFGTLTALDDVSFRVPPQTVFATTSATGEGSPWRKYATRCRSPSRPRR